MGCILGRDRRGSDEPNNCERSSDGQSLNVTNVVHAVRVENETAREHRRKVQGGVGVEGNGPACRLRNELNFSSRQEWPSWLMKVAGDVIGDWTPRQANSFEKLEKIGQGMYGDVYKARDLMTGKIVALKRVWFDDSEEEYVEFMAREIAVLSRLDHPNVLKLEGLATSRMSCYIYLVFQYMEHDLAGLLARQEVKFTEPQVKCFMKQLLSGLEHCHNQGVLHRDLKSSNLLIDTDGVLKIGDFGLASFYDPEHKVPMTNRVVSLWYRPPELLLGATCYDVGVDLWSVGCIMAELLGGFPIIMGHTEVEQLHLIFNLCGFPSEEYLKKSKLPNAALFNPQPQYKRCITETFKNFPSSALPLIETLLSIDPDERGTATKALHSEFFATEPYACEPSDLPKYPPSKEIDFKLRHEEARRQAGPRGNAVGYVLDPEVNMDTRLSIGRYCRTNNSVCEFSEFCTSMSILLP